MVWVCRDKRLSIHWRKDVEYGTARQKENRRQRKICGWRGGRKVVRWDEGQSSTVATPKWSKWKKKWMSQTHVCSLWENPKKQGLIPCVEFHVKTMKMWVLHNKLTVLLLSNCPCLKACSYTCRLSVLPLNTVYNIIRMSRCMLSHPHPKRFILSVWTIVFSRWTAFWEYC